MFRNQWAYHELLHTHWEGGRVQQNLPLFGQIAQKLLHHLYKVLGQELICLLGKMGKTQDMRITVWQPSQLVKSSYSHTSSNTTICTWLTLATPFLMRSKILPGVAMITCTTKGTFQFSEIQCLQERICKVVQIILKHIFHQFMNTCPFRQVSRCHHGGWFHL